MEVKDGDDALVGLLRHSDELLVGRDGDGCDLLRLVRARQEALDALLQVENACVVPCRVEHRLLVHVRDRLANITLDAKVVPVQQRRHRHGAGALVRGPRAAGGVELVGRTNCSTSRI